MIKKGYYIKARQIQNSVIAVAPPHIRETWDWLLKEANHKDNKYGGFLVKRGQLFRTYKEIREGLHWKVGYRKMMYSENHTKKAMKFLREHRMITTTKALGGVLITIVKYDYYQDPKNYESTNERTNESTIPKPSRNHGVPDNNKNEKNDKNEKSKAPKVAGAKPAKKVPETFLKGSQWNDLIDSFADVNPMYLDFYKNTTERKALDVLAKSIGFEKLLGTVRALAEITAMPFAPKITTPSELKRDLGKLATFYKQELAKNIKGNKDVIL